MGISPEDCEVEIFRQGSIGGQQVGLPLTTMRVTHKASGMSVTIPAEMRSQYKQRQLALEMLEYGLSSLY